MPMRERESWWEVKRRAMQNRARTNALIREGKRLKRARLKACEQSSALMKSVAAPWQGLSQSALLSAVRSWPSLGLLIQRR